MFSLIDLEELRCKVLGFAGCEFLDGVNACGLEELRELRTDTLYTEEVCMIYPGEDELRRDTGLLCDFLASLCGSAFLEEILYLLNADSLEFGSICITNTLDVNNFVTCHDKNF